MCLDYERENMDYAGYLLGLAGIRTSLSGFRRPGSQTVVGVDCWELTPSHSSQRGECGWPYGYRIYEVALSTEQIAALAQ